MADGPVVPPEARDDLPDHVYDEALHAYEFTEGGPGDRLGAAIRCAHAFGVAAGRSQAANEIREDPHPDPSPCIPAWHAGYVEAKERAAIVAEGSSGGTD
jgi:hypothetical protein